MPDSVIPATVSDVEAPLVFWLAERAADCGATVFIARSEARMGRLGRALQGVCAGRVEVLEFPPWDVLPYDRVAPSAGIVGQRIRTLLRLAMPGPLPRLVLTSAEAVLQRVPRQGEWAAPVVLEAGGAIDLEVLHHQVAGLGYHRGETVSEAREVAF